jgi:hypothetical protein
MNNNSLTIFETFHQPIDGARQTQLENWELTGLRLETG